VKFATVLKCQGNPLSALKKSRFLPARSLINLSGELLLSRDFIDPNRKLEVDTIFPIYFDK
jgi:hypothetical protein